MPKKVTKKTNSKPAKNTPAKKKKKTTSRKKKTNKPMSGYFLAAFVLILVLYFLTGKTKDTKNDSLVKKENKRHNQIEAQNEKEKGEEVSIKINPEKAIIETEEVFDSILEAAQSLDIPDSYYHPKNRKNDIYLKLPLNPEVDLYFANMIIKGHVEEAGGIVENTLENNYKSKHTMLIFDPLKKQKYTIVLQYDRKRSYKKDVPKLAIIIDDFGQNKNELFYGFTKLDKNVTFAILPDLPHSKEIMFEAKRTKHESIIHLPMEPMGYPRNNPGKRAIFVNMGKNEIRKLFNTFLEQLPLAVGVNNHMGSLATSDEGIMKSVLEVVKENDMYFIDSVTSSSTVAYETAQKMLIPSAKRNIFLDVPDTSKKTTRKYIKKIENYFNDDKDVVVISHCTSEKRLEQLKHFIKEAKNIGFELVPASGLFKTNMPEIM